LFCDDHNRHIRRVFIPLRVFQVVKIARGAIFHARIGRDRFFHCRQNRSAADIDETLIEGKWPDPIK
jgi:hypothetical protein